MECRCLASVFFRPAARAVLYSKNKGEPFCRLWRLRWVWRNVGKGPITPKTTVAVFLTPCPPLGDPRRRGGWAL